MEYTVYGDVLAAVNFVVNLLLLKACCALTHLAPGRGRMIAGAAVGAVCAFVIFIPAHSAVFDILVRLTVSLTVVGVAFGRLRDRLFLRVWAVFFGVSFLAAGVVAGLMALFPSGFWLYRNGTVYLHISPLLLLGCITASYALLCVLGRILSARAGEGGVYTLVIERGGISVQVRALADTGNRLTESFSGWPLVVASYDSVAMLLTDEEQRCARDCARAEFVPTLRPVFYRSVGGEGMLAAFRPDRIRVKIGKESADYSGYVAVLPRGFGAEGYGAVFNPRLIQVQL